MTIMNELNSNMMFTLSKTLIITLILCLNQYSIDLEKDIRAKIDKFLIEQFAYSINQNTKAIVVISERGCMTCNKKFSRLMESMTSENKLVFIITASGGLFDIEHYFKPTEKNNILIDQKGAFHKLKIMQGSGVILLKGKEEIEIIEINPETINSQIKDIKERLK